MIDQQILSHLSLTQHTVCFDRLFWFGIRIIILGGFIESPATKESEYFAAFSTVNFCRDFHG